jgi:predicted short-subunit dehydrogenase-like oxidoreductase (DUF2520 family)
MQSAKIVLIGSGNVASHLGKALKKKKCSILQVYSRSASSAKKLALTLKSSYTNDISQLVTNADIYIVAVSDDAISSVLSQIAFQPSLIVHTSGSVSDTVFSDKFKQYGVLYPLQTFSKDKAINFLKVPIFIQANTKSSLKKVRDLAGLISPSIYSITSEKRKALHIAAVFACNFSNNMYAIAERLLVKEKIPFSVLVPLITETAKKIEKGNAAKQQTGPAVRGDKKLLATHMEFLKQEEDFKKIYTLVSQSIQEFASQYGAKK